MRQPQSIDDLSAAPYNPRKISKKAAAALAKSIGDFGDISGITWNARSGNLVSGHRRVEQLRRAGAEVSDGALVLGELRFPIRVVDWPDGKERAANVVANSPKVAGEFTDGLESLLLELKLDIGDDYTDLRLDELELPGPVEVEEGEAPGPPANPLTREGDVWTLGGHRVVCGDCSEVKFTEPFELLVTDPPYGVNYAAKNAFLNLYDKGSRIQENIENDTHSPDEMSALWVKWFTAIRAFAKPGAAYYVTGPQGGAPLLFFLLALREAGFPLRHMLVWAKNNHVLGRCDFHYKHEPILYGWVDGAGHRFYGGEGCFSLWEIDRPHQSKLHPTMKPVELFAKAIGHSSRPGELVLDPFLGSGTTLIAAEQLNRRCFGVELSPAYCDVIVERWENLTGGKATRQKA